MGSVTVDRGMGGARELRGAVVAPDGHTADGGDGLTHLEQGIRRGR